MPHNKGLDHFRRGRSTPVLGGKVASTGLDEFRRGKPVRTITTVDAVAGTDNIATSEPRIVLAPSNRKRLALRIQAWFAKGGQKTGVAAPPPDRTVPVQFVSRVRRPYRGAATILRGPARIGLADPRVRPAIIVRGSVPPERRAVIQPTHQIGAERIGLADPRSPAPRIVIGGSHRNRGQVIQPRGAAKISNIDPLTRPLLSVRGPLPVGRTLRRQPILTRGAAKIGTADPKPLATRVATALRRPYRGTATFVRGAAKISASDPHTQPATIVRAQSARRIPRQPWLGRHAKDTPVVAQDRSRSPLISIPASARARIRIQPRLGKPVRLGDTDAITRPAKIVTARRSQRAVRQPWLGKHVKDTPLVVTGRTRPVTVIAGSARRRAVTQPFVGKPIHSDARLARALTILPASRPIQPRIQPWMPAVARSVASSARAARLVQQAPSRARRRGQAILSGRIAFEDRIVPSTRVVSAAITRHRAQRRQPRVGVVWSKIALTLPDLHATFGLQPALWATFTPSAPLTAALGIEQRLRASFVLAPALSATVDLRHAVRTTLVLEGWHEDP